MTIQPIPDEKPAVGGDPFGPARGILIGFVLVVPFWAVVALVCVRGM